MIKDRALKATALHYLVSKRYFPQLEVLLLPQLATAPDRRALTDIDVLGLAPDDFEGFRCLLIDCRTLKSQSPVARAFWLRGVMHEVNASRGICVLRGERVEPDHRIAAARSGVLLLTEDEFGAYVKATGGSVRVEDCNCVNLELWERFLELPNRFRALGPAVHMPLTEHWQSHGAANACRGIVALLRKLKGELDPARHEHLAVVANAAAVFTISVSVIVSTVFTSYLQPKLLNELSDALLLVLYGGRDAYESLNALRRLLKVASDSGPEDLSLPEWDRFVQLVRETLEAPRELANTPLLLREMAWTYLSDEGRFVFAETLAAESPFAAKYALMAVEYLCRASKLPRDFSDILSSQLLALQKVPG
jgi:hypothetical protein